ncbi:hypothetical protein TI03_00980 [Achromatium sp. WMS1]|nr:hypothetical protein TI03_00980 [Achromatium sp. WMS1]
MTDGRQRFDYIDQFRGLIVILMLIDHCSYYLNSAWKHFNPLNPLFDGWEQTALRYSSYFCAPGFLLVAGTMAWWSFHNSIRKGITLWSIRWHLIQRGLFLILLQITWVNSSWSGFNKFHPWHLGIIASIGISLILIAFIVNIRWYIQLGIAVLILTTHPFLLQISYDPNIAWQIGIIQTFIDASSFNKYPVLPWFAMSILGSVMAHGWLQAWKTDQQRINMNIIIAATVLVTAVAIRLNRGYGNVFAFSEFGSWSFFIDQKYPPSLFFSLWFFALSLLTINLFMALKGKVKWITMIFTIPGKTPLFFYCIHIAILGIFIKRTGIFYRTGGIWITLIGFVIMMLIMLPLCNWFYKIKQKSHNFIIRML